MAITFFPFDAGAGANVTEDQWRSMARNWLSDGVIRDVGAKFPVLDTGMMAVNVQSGAAWIRGHYVNSSSTETVAIAAAHATLPRKDRIVLRADFTANTIALVALTGTAASSPVVPALTRSSTRWEIPIAIIDVPAAATAISAAQITDERLWAGIRQASAKAIASQTNITAETTITGLSVPVYAMGGRVLRITVSGNVAVASAASRVRMDIKEDGVTIANAVTPTINPEQTIMTLVAEVTPAEGRRVYSVTLQRLAGTGTVGTFAFGSTPFSIMVDDMGPV